MPIAAPTVAGGGEVVAAGGLEQVRDDLEVGLGDEDVALALDLRGSASWFSTMRVDVKRCDARAVGVRVRAFSSVGAPCVPTACGRSRCCPSAWARRRVPPRSSASFPARLHTTAPRRAPRRPRVITPVLEGAADLPGRSRRASSEPTYPTIPHMGVHPSGGSPKPLGRLAEASESARAGGRPAASRTPRARRGLQVSASAAARTSGSVPHGRTSTRPSIPSASSAATAAAPPRPRPRIGHLDVNRWG